MKTYLAIIVSAAAMLPLGCSTAPESTADKASLAGGASTALDRFRSVDSTLQAELDKAAGYAVLPDIGKGGVVIGGSFGRGEVFEKGSKIGYVKLTEGTVGLQLGAQSFSELIVFKTQAALNDFKDGDFNFAANATAIAIKPGAASTYSSGRDVMVFIHIKGGLMAEAAIGGQKLVYQPL